MSVGSAVASSSAGFYQTVGGGHYYLAADSPYRNLGTTNIDATLKALEAFPGRILVILGGKDKGSDYTPLQKPLREKGVLALLIVDRAKPAAQQPLGGAADRLQWHAHIV